MVLYAIGVLKALENRRYAEQLLQPLLSHEQESIADAAANALNSLKARRQ